MASIHFFLGANTAAGFHSLYEPFCDISALDDLLVIKGGAGMGKSTFMKTLAKAVESVGEPCEYIHCSGDPDSLDAVRFPTLRISAVDGTAPHIIEPELPVAADRCVDLGRFCNIDGAKQLRGELACRNGDCARAYERVYRCLRARQAVEDELRSVVQPYADSEKLRRRMNGILSRELPHRSAKEDGSAALRFLGGATWRGWTWRFDTVRSLASRVYALHDRYGFAAPLLAQAASAARTAGFDVIACLSPERPDALQHLFIPQLSLAFLTVNDRVPYAQKAYRHIRLDAAIESAVPRGERARLRLLRRLSTSIEQEVFAALREAKGAHDELEKLYHPLMDFEGIAQLAKEESERLCELAARREK
ncbi:MAG: hypothetical protein IJF15_01365 [Oscillospiraceae bacterium]|nr:hypothetical protein [Oscillospiraceae bacterium]